MLDSLVSWSLCPITELPMQLHKLFYGNQFALEQRNSASRMAKPELKSSIGKNTVT